VDCKSDTEHKDMQVDLEAGDTSIPERICGIKERVSFGTNMTTNEESSYGKTKLELVTTVERFQARKFGAKQEKMIALRVNNSGAAKKKKTPIKSGTQEVLKGLERDEMDDMLLRTKA
jgi:hypothetical protein